MNDNLESQLAEIKTSIDAVSRRVARAEYERDTATAAKRDALANLKELGADTREGAEDLLRQLRAELAMEVETINRELGVGE